MCPRPLYMCCGSPNLVRRCAPERKTCVPDLCGCDLDRKTCVPDLRICLPDRKTFIRTSGDVSRTYVHVLRTSGRCAPDPKTCFPDRKTCVPDLCVCVTDRKKIEKCVSDPKICVPANLRRCVPDPKTYAPGLETVCHCPAHESRTAKHVATASVRVLRASKA